MVIIYEIVVLRVEHDEGHVTVDYRFYFANARFDGQQKPADVFAEETDVRHCVAPIIARTETEPPAATRSCEALGSLRQRHRRS